MSLEFSSSNGLDCIAEKISERIGLDKNLIRWEKLITELRDVTSKPFEEAVTWLVEDRWSPEHSCILAQSLIPSTSKFFRNKRLHQLIEKCPIHEWLNRSYLDHSIIKVWSAGCSTGEELYSIMMQLQELYPQYHYEFFGSDINMNSLQKARCGRYKADAFPQRYKNLRDKYCDHVDGEYLVKKEFRNRVNFFQHNLVYEALPKFLRNVDIILCQNVLIYFSDKALDFVVQKFCSSLSNKGVLITSPFELSRVQELKYLHSLVEYDLSLFRHKPLPPSRKKSKHQKFHHLDRFQIKIESIKEKELSPNFSSDREKIDKLYKNLEKENAKDKKKNLEKIAQEFPLNYYAYYLKGIHLRESDCLREALDAFNACLYLKPDCYLALFMLGNILYQKGTYQEGERTISHLVELLSKKNKDEHLPEDPNCTLGDLKSLAKQLLDIWSNVS